MEDLLTPQICMDIDETPLDVGKDDDSSADSSSESGEPEMGEDGKVKLLLEENFTDSAQVPEELTDFEKDAKKNVFAIGEPAVQFHRLHCTACNIHLGSAPIGHFNRYIHPLLKVLLCKPCYEFYCSGEFDKDEDGSEMYCRWCGQGGKVMCCAQCAYVFCQKCVRQNLGKRTLELIKDSDDWLCFGCNPTQLINLKIVCTSLFDFVQEEIRLSKSLNNIERLKIDHSVCCQKTKAAKRKRDDDATYIPNDWEEQSKPKKLSILKSTLTKSVVVEDKDAKPKTWSQKDEAEVVCTPDLMALMEDDPPPLTPMPKSVQSNKPGPASSLLNKQLNKAQLSTTEQVPTQIRAIRPETKKLYTLAPKTMMICNTNNLQRPPSGFIRLQTPAIKFVPSLNRSTPIVNSIPSQIAPGTKHEWYDKAATVVSTITGNLSGTLMNLTKEQRSAKTVEQLANIHNKLQELLSSSVNSLIQVRKNLRAEFLDDLNKLKFPNSNLPRTTNMSTVTKPKFNHSSNKENDDDDDVIIVNSESGSVKPLAEPPPLVKISEAKSNSRPYLKVRSVSQLLTVSSECITIPDDPPGLSGEGDDVIAVEEKDPLELSPGASDKPIINENDKYKENIIKENVSKYDKETIQIKNTLTESRIEQMVIENMKYKVDGISEEELKRFLSVRVLILTDFGEDLPKNRLKTLDEFVDNTEINLIANEEDTGEETVVETVNVDSQTNNDNIKSSDGADERKNKTNSSDNEKDSETNQMESNKIQNVDKEKENDTEISEKLDNNNDNVLENEENTNCSKELNEDDKRDSNNDSIPNKNDASQVNNSSPENDNSIPENNDLSLEKNDSPPENDDLLPETNDSPPENNDSSPENNDSPPENNDSTPENNDSAPENNDSAPENNDSAPDDDCLSENEALSNQAEEESNIMEENGLDSPNETQSSEKIVDCNESSAISSHSESSVNKKIDCFSTSDTLPIEHVAMDSCTGDDSK